MGWDGQSWIEIDREENFGKEHSASITYLGPWEQRIDFMLQKYGRLQFGGFIPPTKYGPLNIWCNGCKSNPFTIKTEDGEYTVAKVVVSFGTMQDEATNENGEPADIGDERLTISGTTINLPPGQYKWNEGDKSGDTLKEDSDITPFMVLPEIGYSITFNYVQDFDPEKLAGFVGKVNSSAFGPRKLAVGRVMFLGTESDRRLTMQGLKHWKVTYNFSIKGQGATWQKFWDGTAWSKIVTVDGEEPVYTEANLNSVLPKN